MRKNEIYEVLCLDVTNQGYGVVRIDGQVVFVPGLLKEEKARIKIVKVLKKYAFGKIEELQIVSKDRVEPKCPNASQCGGCCFQHLAYTKQLDIKTEYVRQLFIRNHLDCTIKDTLGMQDPFYYRNKAQFPIQVINDTVYMGFYRPHSNSIVDCDSCVIQSKEINEVYQFIKANMNVKSAKTLRHVLIRSNVQGQVQIVFIGKENHVDALVKKITENFKNVVSILFNKNDRDDNVILGDSYRVLYGLESMRQTCMSQKIQLHFKSFFQVNSKQMEVLYSQAIHLANLSKEDRVIDLYSGVGTIGCVIAPYVKKVTGVEIVPEAVENARKNVAQQVNTQLLTTYWNIGRIIVEYEQQNQIRADYGKQTLKELSKELTREFGKGFSRSNLQNMRAFYLAYEKCQTVSGKLSWSHYCELLSITDENKRSFYEKESVNSGWSVRELKRQIDSSLYERLLLSSEDVNKEKVLSLAQKGVEISQPTDIIRDPYVFEFLGVPENKPMLESDLEKALVAQIEKFLLELGRGFMFVGTQQRVTLNNTHYYVDMVFYNKILRAYVLIELKTKKLTPEAAGQLNMYLNYYAAEVNDPDDNPPIGIILCTEKDSIAAEYALGGLSNNIFASRYVLYMPDKEQLIAQVEAVLKNWHEKKDNRHD